MHYMAIGRAGNGQEWGREWDAASRLLGNMWKWDGWPAYWNRLTNDASHPARDSEHVLRFHALIVALRCLGTDAANEHYWIEARFLHAANEVDSKLDRQQYVYLNPSAFGLSQLSDELRRAFNITNLTAQQKSLLERVEGDETGSKWLLLTGGPGTGKTLTVQVRFLHV